MTETDDMGLPAKVGPGGPTRLCRYWISGLVVQSEVELPSATIAADEHQAPDIVIRAGDVPARLESPLHTTEAWETRSGLFLLRIPGVARFLIVQGREIVFDLSPEHEPRTVALYLLGTCFAILLQQRGNLVLHASAIAADGRAMLFCGRSGAGKSTMAAMLCRRGYALLNDDVCNLTPAIGDTYEVRPDGRMLKLWSESLDQLEWTTQPGMAVRADQEKYFFAPPVSEVLPQPVAAIYILRETPPNEDNSIRRLRSIEGMNELKRNAYRPALVTAMEMERAYFTASVALQRSAGVYLLSRPLAFDAAGPLLDLLEDHWNTLSSRVSMEPSTWTMRAPSRAVTAGLPDASAKNC
jgi:hypothetical protein